MGVWGGGVWQFGFGFRGLVFRALRTVAVGVDVTNTYKAAADPSTNKLTL